MFRGRTLEMQLTPEGLALFAPLLDFPLPGCAAGHWLNDEDDPVRPTDDEVCPGCGGTNITASSEIPPMSCGDCGDRWAGLYRKRVPA